MSDNIVRFPGKVARPGFLARFNCEVHGPTNHFLDDPQGRRHCVPCNLPLAEKLTRQHKPSA